MNVFTIVGMIVSGIVGLAVAVVLTIWLFQAIKEAVAGIKCVLWLHGEWKQMVEAGTTENETIWTHIKYSVKFFVRYFGHFQDTTFTSKLGNKFN